MDKLVVYLNDKLESIRYTNKAKSWVAKSHDTRTH